MNYFGIKLGTDGGEQAQLIDQLRSSGCETIQVSDGIAVKTDKCENDLSALLADKFKVQIERLSSEIKSRFPS